MVDKNTLDEIVESASGNSRLGDSSSCSLS